MSATAIDKTLVAVGAALFVGACTWAFFQQGSLGDIKSTTTAPSFGENYEVVEVGASVEGTRTWPAPSPLPRGRSWVYDVFTPPDIYYDKTTEKFRAVLLGVPVVAESREFGLVLLEVNQTPFPLQLMGYAGAGARARGVFFEDTQASESFLGASGEEVPELNLKVVDFSASEQRIEVPGETTRVVNLATAIVQDTATNHEYRLSNQETLMTDEISATVKVMSSGAVQRLAEGAMLKVNDGVTYVIDKISTSPPMVTVSKRISGSEDVRIEVLTPQAVEETPLVPAPAPAAEDDSKPNPFAGF